MRRNKKSHPCGPLLTMTIIFEQTSPPTLTLTLQKPKEKKEQTGKPACQRSINAKSTVCSHYIDKYNICCLLIRKIKWLKHKS